MVHAFAPLLVNMIAAYSRCWAPDPRSARMPSCVNAQVLLDLAGGLAVVLDVAVVGAEDVGVGVSLSAVAVSVAVSVGTSVSDVALTELSGEPSPDVLVEWHADTVASAATHARATK